MFFDANFSQFGRTSGQQLNGLRRQLGVGVDPVFDYSQMSELAKDLTKKEEKTRQAPASQEPSGGPPLTSLEQLRRALHDVSGPIGGDAAGGGGGGGDAGAGGDEVGGIGAGENAAFEAQSPGQARARREQLRPSASFKACSRDKRQQKDAIKDCAPPIGNYRPKDTLCRPRQKDADFGLKSPTKSKHTLQLEKQIADLKAENKPFEHLVRHAVSIEEGDTPERLKLTIVVPDLARSVPHADPCQNAVPRGKLEYNVNSFTAGVLDGDIYTSSMKRNPVWDFAKLRKEDPLTRDSYFVPGQYTCNMDAVRPRILTTTVAFDRQRPRPKPEGKKPTGHHLPDRSLSRSCPALTNSISTKVPDFSKYTVRPKFFRPAEGYHDLDDPLIDQQVMHHNLTFDVVEADRVLHRRPAPAECWDTGLTREECFKTCRAYHESIPLQRAKDNLAQGLRSLDLLPTVESSKLQRRVRDLNFTEILGRDTEKKHTASPSRMRNQGNSVKFEREVRYGDSRVDTQKLSSLSSSIQSMRAGRTWEALPVEEVPSG